MNGCENMADVMSLLTPKVSDALTKNIDTIELVKKASEIQEQIGLNLDTKVCEEMGELLAALMQTQTYKARERENEGWDEVFNECADVIVTIMVMCYRIGGKEQIEDVDAIIRYKLIRTIKRFERGEPV